MFKSHVGLLAIAVAGAVQAATWKVSLTEPDQQGLVGESRLTDGLVDIGAIQSTILDHGLMMIFR